MEEKQKSTAATQNDPTAAYGLVLGVFLRSRKRTSVASRSFTSRQPPPHTPPPVSLTLPLPRETPPQPCCRLVSAGPGHSQHVASQPCLCELCPGCCW